MEPNKFPPGPPGPEQSFCDALTVLGASLAAARRQAEHDAPLAGKCPDGLAVLRYVTRCCELATEAIERYCAQRGHS